MAACLFTEPVVEADDTWLFDYSLFFIASLEEYLEQTDDKDALKDLYEVAMQQAYIAVDMLDENAVVTEAAASGTLIDWNDDFKKDVCAQAVLIYSLRYAKKLAARCDDNKRQGWCDEILDKLTSAARNHFYDEEKGCFVSDDQASIAAQVWMVLAEVCDDKEARSIMERADEFMEEAPMNTSYMHHYYVMALLKSGLRDKALEHIRYYWGSMIEAGADTFWESWKPDDPEASPPMAVR